ncbi:MAG: 50S ribosomal protein L16 [Alphaproteobacteria bacterium]|nr:50S ribosomal protein L16 [Alphaproteobacteria bacterium]
MLQPKRTKYRKAFKGRISGAAKGGFNLDFGSYGLKAMEPDRLTARQIEAARRAAARVKPGRILFELEGVPVLVAKEALALAAAKLPIKTRFVARVGVDG